MEQDIYRIQEQVWSTNNRYIIMHRHGSIQVQLFKEEQEDGIKAYAHNLYVDLNYRCKGIAKLLLEMAENITKNHGYDKIGINWDINDTPREILDWYKRCGYEEIGHFRHESCTLEKKLI